MAQTTLKTDFSGLRVHAFESRLADEMAALIQKSGGKAHVTPSMREVPLEVNREALAFVDRLFAGKLDMVILMTGVGTRFLARVAHQKHSPEAFKSALKKVKVVVRGPKPVKVLHQLGLKPDISAPEPNTWREILTELDHEAPVKDLRIAVQEYGIPNSDFLKGLRDRGAQVIRVPVYQWALPEDIGPFIRTIRTICDGEADVLVFTNAAQIYHCMRLAHDHGLADSLREAAMQCVIASVGPTTSEALAAKGFAVDFEPSHAKMGILIRELSQKAVQILKNKQAPGRNIPVRTSPHKPQRKTVQNKTLQESVFLKACRREKTPYTPIWLMRQAGRYMPEYRKIRARHGILEIAKTPELSCEVTVTAAERLGVDAAIIFADILLIIEPMGVGIEFIKGEGPVIHRPVRSRQDIDSLQEVHPTESLAFVYEAMRLIRRALKPNIPLIGFSAAPFTLASYLAEGGPSKDFRHTKTLMYQEEAAWHRLMEFITTATAEYLNNQIQAGAQAIQIFDSWVGTLSPCTYERYVLPHSQRLISALTPGTPVVHFGTGTGVLLEKMTQAGGDVIGIDWRVELDSAWKRIGHNKAIMGNLDPVVLLSDPKTIRGEAKRILDQAAGRPGHIFNLGHGVLPQIPVENVITLVETVHELSKRD